MSRFGTLAMFISSGLMDRVHSKIKHAFGQGRITCVATKIYDPVTANILNIQSVIDRSWSFFVAIGQPKAPQQGTADTSNCNYSKNFI